MIDISVFQIDISVFQSMKKNNAVLSFSYDFTSGSENLPYMKVLVNICQCMWGE
jgi:hypothetical protein